MFTINGEMSMLDAKNIVLSSTNPNAANKLSFQYNIQRIVKTN